MKSVEGIILKRTSRREADAVFTLYTKEHGLMELVAKGVRKSSAKLKSGLDIFNHAEIFYAPAKHWPIITDFKIKNDFNGIKQNLFRLKLSNFASGAVLKIFEHGSSDLAVWQGVLGYFAAISRLDLTREHMIDLVYSWCHDILVLNGLDPKSPDFKVLSDDQLKKRTQNLFQYHFGIDLKDLI